MKVTGIAIKQFTAFEDIEIEFSPGLNVFIGANATGKSHLMKLLYSYTKTAERRRSNSDPSVDKFEAKLGEKLAGVFRPDDDQVERLVRRPSDQEAAGVQFTFTNRQVCSMTLNKGGELTTDFGLHVPPEVVRCMFVPSREVLTMFEGFIAAYQHRELSFDETYYDLCVALSASPLRRQRESDLPDLLEPLEHILGGNVKLEGGRFYLHCRGRDLEAHLLAEGMRKIACLASLISNGSLMQNAILFWDEPEANLNPALITKVAEMLRKLVDGGVQVFIATHDYLLSHELSLACEYGVKPLVDTRFFAFDRRNEAAPVTIEQGETLADLENNLILEEFAKHYERERDLFAQDGASE